MKISKTQADQSLVAELGTRLAQRRLNFGLTQAQLAAEAGVSKRTVERLEAGASAQLLTLVRVLRALELLERLDALVPEATPSPMDLLKLSGKQRQRASKKNPESAASNWQWKEEP